MSEPTVSRYLRRLRRHTHPEKAKRWLAFLNNHREVIAGLDFFTVPTLNFGVLYCFFVIEHGRRRILHFNTTAHPTSEWIIQQLREAFPLPSPQRFVVLDRADAARCSRNGRNKAISCSPGGKSFPAPSMSAASVLASRSAKNDPAVPATVRFNALPSVHREAKFEALQSVKLNGTAWVECPAEWRSPFLPASQGAWGTFPKLEELFAYNGAGVQPKRTWVIAPDSESLIRRWQKLVEAPVEQKELLFHATMRDGKPADRHIRSVVKEAIPGFQPNLTPLIDEKGKCPPLQAHRALDKTMGSFRFARCAIVEAHWFPARWLSRWMKRESGERPELPRSGNWERPPSYKH